MRKQILKPWQEMSLEYRLEVYDAYVAAFDGYGFTDEPESFDDFDAAMYNSVAAAVRRLYIRG